MNISTFNMSFYMSNRSMYTIDAIRHGIRTATTRWYNSEISLIQQLNHSQPVLFNRTDGNDNIVDSIIVFAINNTITKTVGYKLPSYSSIIDNNEFIQEWCNLEGWDKSFALSYFETYKKRELWQFRYSLYPPNYNYSPDIITQLKDNEVFLMGTNLEGRHGAGAAKLALNKFGAIYGQAEGLQGQSYGLITTDLNKSYRPSVSIELLTEQVNKFIQFAKDNPHLTFLVTEVGCGLAGFTVEQVAPLFKSILLNGINNVRLPKKFVRHLIVNSIESIL